MGIVYKYGDVVEAFKNGEIDVLVHGVNCQGKMNSGIAKQIRAEFPKAFKHYRESFFQSDEPRPDVLGFAQFVKIEDNKFIVNGFTQDKYGYDKSFRFCSYDAIDQVISQLRNSCLKSSIDGKKIGMPKIGAGLGGGNWKVIEAIISSHFTDRDVYVYTLEEQPRKSGQNDMG